MTSNGRATDEIVPTFLTMGRTKRGGKAKITSKKVKSIGLTASLVAAFALTGNMSPAVAAPGDLLATVTLPGNGGSVGGSTVPGGPSGIVYIAPRAFVTGTWDIYLPPPGPGAQVAALLATKTFVDGEGNPVAVSCGTWDPKRNVLWVANTGMPGPVHSVDLGDLTASGTALATFEFNSNVGGASLCDGIAYDEGSDTLWISPDVNLSVFEFALPGGAPLNTVSPENAAGVADGAVSGVTIGSGDTLYIGRNGFAEIRLVDKTTGNFISQFATTSGRVEDLSCDPVTYAPLSAILSKDAFNGLYEAFEVEADTCPLPPIGIMIDIKFLSNPNGYSCKKRGVLPVLIFGMDDLDVFEIDIASLRLSREDGVGGEVGPPTLRKVDPYEDRGDPDDKGVAVDGVDVFNPDGIADLSVGFDSRDVAALIGCDGLNKGDDSATLVLTGELNNGVKIESIPVGDPGID